MRSPGRCDGCVQQRCGFVASIRGLACEPDHKAHYKYGRTQHDQPSKKLTGNEQTTLVPMLAHYRLYPCSAYVHMLASKVRAVNVGIPNDWNFESDPLWLEISL